MIRVGARDPMGPAWPLTLYYDRSCPLCRVEMATLAEADRGRRLRMVDCSAPGFDDADCSDAGVVLEALMSRLHGRDADGRWFVGVPAFAAAYSAVGVTALGRFLANRRLQPLLATLYGWIADHRQGLSRLGLTGLFGRHVRWLAARAQRRASACHDGSCDMPH